MNQEKELELLAYLVTSAANLSEEPAYYGALRLIEAADRLTMLLLEQDGENAALRELAELIEAHKHKGMTAPVEFQQMLDAAAEKLTDCF